MRLEKLRLIVSLCALLLFTCCFLSVVEGDAVISARTKKKRLINSISTIINDMIPPHQGHPHGVPESYDWADGPRIGYGNDCPENFRAMIAWGQIYEDADGNPATNTRVQIKGMKAYMLRKSDGKWHQLQSSRLVQGNAYREDFANDDSKPADERQEPDGTISVTAGGGYNFHFWPATGRVSIDPTDIAGIFTTAQARLIVNDPEKPDDRAEARYLMDVGGDYWFNRTVSWLPHGSANGDIGIGKFKYVTKRWQAFNMYTLSEKELRRNPPPLS